MNYLYVEADWNDADYISEMSEIGDNIEFFEKVAKAIKECNGRDGHNWPEYDGWEALEELYEGVLTEEEIERFSDYVPNAYESDGVHSIEAIKIYEVNSIKNLLNE